MEMKPACTTKKEEIMHQMKGNQWKKKLLAKEKDCIRVTCTEEGIKTELNSGTYELMKQTTGEYYLTVQQGIRYQSRSVNDKQGFEVEW